MTDDSDDYETVHVEVPKRTKKLAKENLEYGGLSRVVREALSRVAHGEQTTERERVKDHLRELRDDRRDLKRKRSNIDDELDEIEIKIERAEQRLEELQNTVSEYEGALQVIEETMRENESDVFVGHAQVQKAADVGECTQEDVIEDLKDRNDDLDDDRFTEGL